MKYLGFFIYITYHLFTFVQKDNDFRRYGNNTLIDEQVLVKSGSKNGVKF